MKLYSIKKSNQFTLSLILLSITHVSIATQIETAESLQIQQQNTAIKSQQRVEILDDQAQKMLDEFREISFELENIRAYHQQLKKIVHSQEQEKKALSQQILDIDITQRNITPLMLRMLQVLEQFVSLDAPFLAKERTLRVTQLKLMMDRSDIDLAEKFRRVLEAYLVETDYGRTIESYNGTLKDSHITVEFLRLGRLGLYYLSLDESEAGYWDKQENKWQILPDDYRSAISQGIRIAKKQAAPDLLQLPLPAPESVQ